MLHNPMGLGKGQLGVQHRRRAALARGDTLALKRSMSGNLNPSTQMTKGEITELSNIIKGPANAKLTPQQNYILVKACMNSGSEDSFLCGRMNKNPGAMEGLETAIETFEKRGIDPDDCFEPENLGKCYDGLLAHPKYFQSGQAKATKGLPIAAIAGAVAVVGIAAYFLMKGKK